MPLDFNAKRGYRQNTPAGGAPTGPNLLQIQLWRAGNVPAAHAEHAHLFFFFRHVVGANGTML